MSFIGQYRIVGKLGAGGMGTVLLGEHRLLGRRAAIKTLQPSLSTCSELVDRFFNEARATSAIADPGVVQVFDFGYHVDGTAYIVMELLEGEPLSKRIAKLGRLSLVDALRTARQIAGSLAAAHARDIVHRDLKPENIYLVPDPEAIGGERPKLLDFGICKLGSASGSLTQTGTTFGTPAFMSPEQCRGAGEVDHRADIYSLGCVLFVMITGRPPFDAEAPGDLMVSHLRDRPPAPSSVVAGIPAELDAVILRCLEKRADDRFPSMAALQAAIAPLEAIVADLAPLRSSGLQVQPAASPLPIEASTWDLPLPKPRGPRAVAITIACGALSAMIGIAGWVYSDGAAIASDTGTGAAIAAPVAPVAPADGAVDPDVVQIDRDASVDAPTVIALPVDAMPIHIEPLPLPEVPRIPVRARHVQLPPEDLYDFR